MSNRIKSCYMMCPLKRTGCIRCLLFALVALGVLATPATGTPSSEFQRLLKNPKMFNGKRVTLVGLADIGGSEFFLYPDVRSAKHGENAIFVDAHIFNDNPYKKFNNHWLKVTGVVDRGIRPPLGVGECSIVLEQLKLLPRSPLREIALEACSRIALDTPSTLSFPRRLAMLTR